MIVKRIDTKQLARPIKYARDLTDYMRDATVASRRRIDLKLQHALHVSEYIADHDDSGSSEKVLYQGAINCRSKTFAGWQREIEAVLRRAPNAKKPVRHWVMSWQHGETPTREQIEEAVRIFAREQGIPRSMIIWAAHQNTRHIHIHLCVICVDPISYRSLEMGNGHDWEAGHRAIAWIEHHQGWASEQNALYRIEGGRPVHRDDIADRDQAGGKNSADRTHASAGRVSLSARATAHERRTGLASAERIAKMEAAPIMRAADTWEQVHCNLAAIGIRFQSKGSGGVFIIGNQQVKGSLADRQLAWSKLTERLGAYRPAADDIQVAEREQQVIHPRGIDYLRYQQEFHTARVRMKARLTTLRQQRGHVLAALRADYESKRSAIQALQLGGRDLGLTAIYSNLAHAHAAARAEIMQQFKSRERAVRLQLDTSYSFDDWQHAAFDTAALSEPDCSMSSAAALGGGTEPQVHDDIRNFRGRAVAGVVHYHRYRPEGEHAVPAFTDHGRVVWIHDHHDAASVRAALQLAQAKWGRVHVTGDRKYLELCVLAAAQLDIALANPELEEVIARKRRELTQMDYVKELPRIAEAVHSPDGPPSQSAQHASKEAETPVVQPKRQRVRPISPAIEM